MLETESKKELFINGMTCQGCELKIENKLKSLLGVIDVNANYTQGSIDIKFNSNQISISEIIKTIESINYTVKSINEQNINVHSKSNKKYFQIIQLSIITIIILMIIFLIRNSVEFNSQSLINSNMTYGILFVSGLINSLHCIAMCGGINLSICMAHKSENENKFSNLLPSIFYNCGRVISYTLIGGIVGIIGSVINISSGIKGIGAIISGIFMILMSLNMLNIYPILNKLIPMFPKILGNKLYNKIGKSSPFIIGLLNGFMPCGPLQSMQIYALGTGSFISGALAMLIFSLGTVPLMFGFGAISSLLSNTFTNKIMKVCSILIMILGVTMLILGINSATQY